uniref:Uncharacterized protein n=1 Tax=Oryza barthii TaxID=65489 RepID=A0A0D3GGI8_9ORYZ
MASSWNLGEDDGAAVCSEMDEIDGNGGATSGGALDTVDTDELDTRCSIHATGRTKDMTELGIIYRSFFHDYCAAKLTRDDELAVMRISHGSHNGLVPLNFGETRLLQSGQGFDGSMCQVPRFNYFLSFHGNLVKLLC